MIKSIHRPSIVTVDLDAIRFNIRKKKETLSLDQKIFAVVKANAYGHGALRVAHAASREGVSGFCVSNLDEALELRDGGITEDILVMSYVSPVYVPLAILNNITLSATSLQWLEDTKDILEEAQVEKPCTIHLKIDSGMGRIGLFLEEELQVARELLLSTQVFELEGIFTHFATADTLDITHLEYQKTQFTKILDGFKDFKIPFVHTANSATSLWHDDWNSNLIRFGDAMYGLNPSGKELSLPYELRPALRLDTELIHVKKVAKGEKIGYGATYVAKEEEWIGTVPIGYADGLLRVFQGYSVLIDGAKVPIVGRVCMDQCMIRLPKEYAVGEVVTIFGLNGKLYNSLEDAAEYIGSINYEITCGLSDRLPRVYREGTDKL